MEIILLFISGLSLALIIFLFFKRADKLNLNQELSQLIKGEFYQNREELTKNLRENREEITQSIDRLNEVLSKKAKEDREELRTTLKDFQESF